MNLKSMTNCLRAGAVILGVAAMAGCSTPQTSKGPLGTWSKMQIAESVERLELYARPDGIALSARDETAVAHFLQSYGQNGDGPLYVNMPNFGQGHQGMAQTRHLIKRIMTDIGLGGAPIQTGHYQAMRGTPAPVVVSFRQLKTMPYDCRKAGNLSQSYSNQPHDSFGCSYYANLAAMIEDPRQLLEPYPMTSSDMQRRMTVYDKFIKGENPASEQPERQEISAEQE